MQKSRLKNIDEIKTLYESGLTLQAIGVRFGVSRQAVHDRLRRAGIERRPRRQPPLQLNREVLHQFRVVERLTLAEISAKLGVSISVVGSELRRHGIKRVKNHIDRAVLERVYIAEGLTQIETAARLGVSLILVQRELTRHAITFRHKRPRQPPRFSYDLLYGLYHTDLLNCRQIGEKLGCSGSSVYGNLRRHGIKIRHNGRIEVPIITDRETLHRLYIVDDMTRPQIGKMFGVSLAHVVKALRQYGLRKTKPTTDN
jgi:DNA-binding transcriptional regulator LsrR (DeoR family)